MKQQHPEFFGTVHVTLEQINQLNAAAAHAAMSLAVPLRKTIFQQLQNLWTHGNTNDQFATTFLRLTNDVARGGNPGVMKFLFSIQQFWIDSLLKNLELTDDMRGGRNVTNNTWKWSTILLSGGQQSTPCIEFLGGTSLYGVGYINMITNLLFLKGQGIAGNEVNNIFRFAQLHTIFSAYQNAFNPYTATNDRMIRQNAFMQAYNLQGLANAGQAGLPRANLPLYNAQQLIQIIQSYPADLSDDFSLQTEDAFVSPTYYLVEKIVDEQFKFFRLPPRKGQPMQGGGFKNSKKRRKRKKTRKRKRRKYRTIKKKRRRKKVKSLKRRRRRRRKTRGK